MNNKYFIITVDTEGDNLWAKRTGDRSLSRIIIQH